MEDLNKEIEKLPKIDQILPLIQKEAKSKGLQVFLFENKDLEKYFAVKYKDIGVITVSKDIDGATWNLQNFRHSYLVNLSTSEV
jgi:hypothetical protein